MAVAYLPLSILLSFSTYIFFYFLYSFFLIYMFFFFNLDISTDLGNGLFFCVF